jgi:hypothetical protein
MQAVDTTQANEDEKVRALHDRIDDTLRDRLDEKWEQVLAEWEGGAPSQKKAVQAYVSGLRNRIVRSLMEIDTLDELERGVAIQYIEVKCHWTMLNTRIQNQTASDGMAAEDLIYRATCVSLIIEGLEPLLSQERVDRLTDMLAEPLE